MRVPRCRRCTRHSVLVRDLGNDGMPTFSVFARLEIVGNLVADRQKARPSEGCLWHLSNRGSWSMARMFLAARSLGHHLLTPVGQLASRCRSLGGNRPDCCRE
jgi:hypothetical protein